MFNLVEVVIFTFKGRNKDATWPLDAVQGPSIARQYTRITNVYFVATLEFTIQYVQIYLFPINDIYFSCMVLASWYKCVIFFLLTSALDTCWWTHSKPRSKETIISPVNVYDATVDVLYV